MEMAAFRPLTVRNLSSIPIEVIRYEIKSGENSTKEKKGWRGAPKTSSGFNTTGHSSQEHSIVEDITTGVPILGTLETTIRAPNSPAETVIIFVKLSDEIFTTIIPYAACHSQFLARSKDNPDPDSSHFSIYHFQNNHLVITSHGDYRCWMRRLQNEVLLPALSIPGTHNSPACFRALPSVRCQVTSVIKQLESGIRFLDFRLQQKCPSNLSKKELILVHGAFSVALNSRPLYFEPVLKDIQNFLAQNPSETVILSLKREGTGGGTDAQFCRLIRKHYANDDQHWFTAPRIPFLGEVRGKIVLVRRFDLDEDSRHEYGGAGWGVDAANWDDNSAHTLCSSGHFCIQDFYQVLETKNIEKKIQYSVEHLKRSAERECRPDQPLLSNGMPSHPFYINFLTASNLWKTGCWPEKIAAKLNPAILQYLCIDHHDMRDAQMRGDGSTGIVICDWVGYRGNWDIVKCIIGMNAIFERSSENPPASIA